MSDPCGYIDQYRVFELYLQLHVSPGLPGYDGAYERREDIDDYPYEVDSPVRQQVRQRVYADVSVVPCRRDRAYHGEPEDDQLDHLVGPEQACFEHFPQDDLADRNENERPEQDDECGILGDAAETLESGNHGLVARFHSYLAAAPAASRYSSASRSISS